jgi:hypothetical protein
LEGGEGVPINPPSHLFPRRGQRMQIVHHLPVKNRRPMISLHAVSGPWTSFVAALDKGRFNIAVCRRYTFSLVQPPPPSICQSTVQSVARRGWEVLSPVGDHILQEFNTMCLTRLRTYNIARPSPNENLGWDKH